MERLEAYKKYAVRLGRNISLGVGRKYAPPNTISAALDWILATQKVGTNATVSGWQLIYMEE